MQYLAAYTLASLGGKEPTHDQITAILKATGKPVDDAQVTAVVNSLKGKKLEDLIKAGSSKLGSGSSTGASKPAAKKQQPAKKVQEKKKETVKAPQPAAQEDDFGGAGDLFG